MANEIEIRWNDDGANETGVFEGQDNSGSWVPIDQLSVTATTDESFDFSTQFESGGNGYVAFVSMDFVSSTGETERYGVKINSPTEPVSLRENTGTTDIPLQAAVLVSDDPKVNITHAPGSTKVTLSWDGQSWTIDVDGTPISGCEVNVSADQVTIVVNNSQANTVMAIYESLDTTHTRGQILETSEGTSMTYVATLSSGSLTLVTNVFRELQQSGSLPVQ